jgi:Bromodomain
MEDTTKKAATKKSSTAAVAVAKKKRANPRPSQQDPKTAKKKKKDAVGPVDQAAAPADVPDANAAPTTAKKRKKTTATLPVGGGLVASNVVSSVATTVAATATNATAGGTVAISSPVIVEVDSIDWSSKPLVDQVLYRLTEGIPRMELKTMDMEAGQCEQELMRDIELLEAALRFSQLLKPGPEAHKNDTDLEQTKKKRKNDKEGETDDDDKSKNKGSAAEAIGMSQEEIDKQVDMMIDNPLTPLDKYYTLSALMGRLRDDLALPSLREPSEAVLAAAAGNKKKKANSSPAPTYPQLMDMSYNNPNYTMIHPDPPTQLLQVWRKIASHRTSTVFRKPVKSEEAPGYAERILFPMDLSLVRKMIVARILTSYSEVHQKIRIICHNCVKYNGRYVRVDGAVIWI